MDLFTFSFTQGYVGLRLMNSIRIG